ncbi:hypothetical protein IMCC3135_31970 [Granulosicoccus antarcticus IMCC3135]|uniref:Uncharacterized protein n=1 Tax=Granulosicoccus antarcticus IMCC3135 TaxID=1192854 RepID=A0A2Z2P1L9_9GAMM|nr:hypothetical protein IMCC3135_31970 [Granulosicoccus antarcticus IMCC3135]
MHQMWNVTPCPPVHIVVRQKSCYANSGKIGLQADQRAVFSRLYKSRLGENFVAEHVLITQHSESGLSMTGHQA